jgi:hypothetical protein
MTFTGNRGSGSVLIAPGSAAPSVEALVAGGYFPVPTEADPNRRSTVDLLASARVVTGDGRWIGGLANIADNCGIPNIAVDCVTDPDPWNGFPFNTRNDPGGRISYPYTPFWLIGQFQCSTFGITPADIQAGARAMLDGASASYALEWELASGISGVLGTEAPQPNPSFQDATPIPGGPVADATNVLGMLEWHARDIMVEPKGAPGLGRYMIYASPLLATYWAGAGLLRKENGLLLTYLDTIVTVSSAYTFAAAGGEGSSGSPDTAFLTGIPTVYLGDIADLTDASGSLDREGNTLRGWAARPAAVVWPPCLPPMSLGWTIPGTPTP